MPYEVNGVAAFDGGLKLRKWKIERKDPGPHDVQITITHAGICHSDLHQLKGDWGNSKYPMIPGHEILGTVSRVGESVTKYREGDIVGVGCFIDSCRSCVNCKDGLENYCLGENHGRFIATYNDQLPDGSLTFGGYSQSIVVDEHYVLRIPENLSREGAAPLLCAGITVYSPIKFYDLGGDQKKIGVLGLGGLGHMAVKILAVMGTEVTVLSTSSSKEKEALELGAKHFVNWTEEGALERIGGTFDGIIDTVSAEHELDAFLGLLKTSGKYVVVGMPNKPFPIAAQALAGKRLQVGGSMIGGIPETQEMLDFCAKNGIECSVEVIPANYINKALKRLEKNDVHYRFVIDVSTLSDTSPEVEDN